MSTERRVARLARHLKEIDMRRTKVTEHATDARSFLEALVGPLTFGSMLRSIRLGEELSQADFAAILGIPKQNLSDIENARRSVSVERAAEWARKLEYSESQFVRLALQAQVDAAKLSLSVTVTAAQARAVPKATARLRVHSATKRKKSAAAR